MRTKFNNSELAHVWTKQNQQRGEGSSMYFDGNTIYSYGAHFPIATIKGSVVFFTNRSYSNSTAKHINHVWMAVSHMHLVIVPFPNAKLNDGERGKTNESLWVNQLHELTQTANNKRCKPKTRETAKARIASVCSQIREYITLTEQTKDFQKSVLCGLVEVCEKSANVEDFNTVIAKAEAKAEAKRKRETAKERKQAKADLPKWINGEIRYINPDYLDGVYLRSIIRYGENVVETTKQATVSMKAAKVLFEMIKAGKDIKGHNIDGYTVIGINGTLKIGCHEIARKEVNRFAASQGW